MKKCIMFVLLITLLLPACTQKNNNDISLNEPSGVSRIEQNKKNYNVFVYDFSDSIALAEHSVEYDFADLETYKNNDVPINKTVSVNDLVLCGEYKKTEYRNQDYFPSYWYTDSSGKFCVDETGKLIAYIPESSIPGNFLSKEECVKIATDFISNIHNVSDYAVEVKDYSEEKMYSVVFTKYVDGIKTTDSASISICYDGSLVCYYSFMLGRVSKNIDASEIDFDAAYSSVINKLETVYSKAKNHYDEVKYGEPNVLLTTLKDGKVGLIYWIDVDCVENHGETTEVLSERINMVVVVSDN